MRVEQKCSMSYLIHFQTVVMKAVQKTFKLVNIMSCHRHRHHKNLFCTLHIWFSALLFLFLQKGTCYIRILFDLEKESSWKTFPFFGFSLVSSITFKTAWFFYWNRSRYDLRKVNTWEIIVSFRTNTRFQEAVKARYTLQKAQVTMQEWSKF